MEEPLVTVLMPVRLDGSPISFEYLSQSVSSILKQTYRHFEFIIVDGSPDENTSSVLALGARDRRIQVIREERKASTYGFITNALNQGCRIAQGKYIARMDSDDLSFPNRLQCQVRHLEEHPNIGVVGTWIGALREGGTSYSTLRAPTNPDLISWSLIFGNPVNHPTVMMRRDAIMSVGCYRERGGVEDYDLWARMALVSAISNLPKTLLIYRMIHTVHKTHRDSEAKQQSFEIRKSIVARTLGFSPPESQVHNLFNTFGGGRVGEAEGKKAVTLICNLHRAFERSHTSMSRVGKELVLRDAEAKAIYLVLMSTRNSISASINVYTYARALFPGISMLPRVALTRERVYSFLDRPLRRWPTLLTKYAKGAKWKSG